MQPSADDVSCNNIKSLVAMAVACSSSHLKPLFNFNLCPLQPKDYTVLCRETAALVLLESLRKHTQYTT